MWLLTISSILTVWNNNISTILPNKSGIIVVYNLNSFLRRLYNVENMEEVLWNLQSKRR